MPSRANVRQMEQIIAKVRAAGVEVREMPGWRNRGRRSGSFRPRAAIDHHDASSRKSGEWGALGYIMSGSSISPLSQWQVARCLDGKPKVAIIAAGRCNHAGVGGPKAGMPRNQGNTYAHGVEKANSGSESYTSAAHYAADVLFAAQLEVMNRSTSYLIGHKEWAPGRKSDPSYSMSWRRSRVSKQRSGGSPAPQPKREWDEMATKAEIKQAIRPAVRAEVRRILTQPTVVDGFTGRISLHNVIARGHNFARNVYMKIH